MRHWLLIIPLALAAAQGAPAQDRGLDPSGVWMGMHGPLALMRAGDTLSFSYSAVFGASAHICDGIGVARHVGDGRYEYADGQGTVAFTVGDGRVAMETGTGIASFCGANWPGETFAADCWKPLFRCRVTAARAYFYEVGPLPSKRLAAYLVQGDWVEAVGLVNESSAAWLLVRYSAKGRVTAGLIERDALECFGE
jgi:hypothetical protein